MYALHDPRTIVRPGRGFRTDSGDWIRIILVGLVRRRLFRIAYTSDARAGVLYSALAVGLDSSRAIPSAINVRGQGHHV